MKAALLLLCAALAANWSTPQEVVQELPLRVVRYFSLEGDVELGKLRQCLQERSTPEATEELYFGPISSKARPKLFFVALELPASTDTKKLTRALSKVGGAAEELHWTCFLGGDQDQAPILGQSARDCIVGMASPMRWYAAIGERKFFFHQADKIKPEEIAKRFRTLFGPFQTGEVGTLAESETQHRLKAELTPAESKALLAQLGKLEGIIAAQAEGPLLSLRHRLSDRATSLPPTAATTDLTELAPPRLDPTPALSFLRDAQCLADL